MRNCHVRRLAIQAPDAAAAARGAVLVEDGLRTASLPGESSRLLIVRKLHIGAIPAGVNATAVSRRIEVALAQLPTQAVAAADPAAGSAAAVYFADEVEACVQLAVLGARGQTPDAWFWPHAVAGWRNGYDPAYAVRCGLGAAARQQSGPGAGAHAVVRVVGGLLAAGVFDAALAALEPEDGPVLLQSCGWRPSASRAGAGAHTVQQGVDVRPSTGTRQSSLRLATWAAAWGAGDARTLWLAAALLAADQPARASDPTLAEQAAVWLEQVSAQPEDRPVAGKTAAGRAAASAPALSSDREAAASVAETLPIVEPAPTQSPPWGLLRPSQSAASPAAAAPPPSSGALRSSESGAPSPVEPAQAAFVWWRGLPLQPTAAGGLWFMLPVLARLGINAWLQEHSGLSGVDFAWRVLAALAHTVETPPHDPVWAVLRGGTGSDKPAPTDDANHAVAWWRDQVREWCAALPDLGEAPLRLETIVRRQGWLYITPTHIDVFFDLAQADLRIRRLGLDVDPGWLPSLRRVVTFYYEAGLAGA